MLVPKLRKIAANVVTRGALEPAAEEILSAFQSGAAGADERDIYKIQAYAAANVPFYSKYRNVPFDELPVVDKAVMRSNFQAFLSEGSDVDKLDSASTSGSTGMPFTAYFDKGRALRRHAAVVANYQFMDTDPFGALVFCRAWGELTTKQKAILKAKGHLPFAGVHQDPRSAQELAQWLIDNGPVTIMGYASYIEGLFHTLEEGGVSIPRGTVTGVLGASEAATDYFQAASMRILGMQPRMKYSNMEIGIIGITDENMDIYNIDTSSYHVEILQEDSDAPASPGKPGRIIVTDLHNKAMPFIRYDTGDIGQFAQDAGGEGIPGQLTGLKGRRVDVLIGGSHENPKRLHALQIWGETAKIQSLRQFQLRQHGVGDFTWILNAEPSSQLEEKLREILSSVVLILKKCNFTYTQDVPVTASGKRQFFVNEMSVEELDGIAG